MHVMTDWPLHQLALPFPRCRGSCSGPKPTSGPAVSCCHGLPRPFSHQTRICQQNSCQATACFPDTKMQRLLLLSLFPTMAPNTSTLPLRLSITCDPQHGLIRSGWRQTLNTSGSGRYMSLLQKAYLWTYSSYQDYTPSHNTQNS